jgi:hypothetical protein
MPRQVHRKRNPKIILSVIIFVLECLNTTWLFFIIAAQTTGIYNCCICKASVFAGGGGYVDFEGIEWYREFGVSRAWTIGTAVGISFPGTVLLFIVYQWCTQAHMKTLNRERAMDGLRWVRKWKRFRKYNYPLALWRGIERIFGIYTWTDEDLPLDS